MGVPRQQFRNDSRAGKLQFLGLCKTKMIREVTLLTAIMTEIPTEELSERAFATICLWIDPTNFVRTTVSSRTLQRPRKHETFWKLHWGQRIYPRVRTTSATNQNKVSRLCYSWGLRQGTDVYQAQIGFEVDVQHSTDGLAEAIRALDHEPGTFRDLDASGYETCKDSAGHVAWWFCWKQVCVWPTVGTSMTLLRWATTTEEVRQIQSVHGRA